MRITTDETVAHVEDMVRLGEDRGLVVGARHAVLRVLAARGREVLPSNRYAVLAESSVRQLMRWIAEAAGSGTAGIALVADDRTSDLEAHTANTRGRLRHADMLLVDDLLTFGVDRGIVTATRLALLEVLTARGLFLSEEERRVIDSTDSIARLLRWLDAAVVAGSAAEILPLRSARDDHRAFSAIADDPWAAIAL